MTKIAIDTAIRHVTTSDSNLFAELGFSEEEAAKFRDESHTSIDRTIALKEELMQEIVVWINNGKYKQEKAAEILHISRPRVSDVVNKKTSKFTLDALVDMLGRVGKQVKFTIS